MEESIIALRRTNQKHWQARLSCSNCLPPCSARLLAPGAPELELTFSSYESDNQLSKQTSREFPLDFLSSSAQRPEQKVDKQTEVNSEYELVERQQAKSELDIKADRKTSKTEKRSSKADKYPIPIDRYPCPLQTKCTDKKAEAKAESKRESKAGSKPESKAESKRESKTGSKAVSKTASRIEPRPEDQEEVCCSRSRSAKSVKSECGNSAAPSNTDSCFPSCFQDQVQDIIMGKEEKKKKAKAPKPAKPPKPPKAPKPPKEPKLEKKSSTKPKPKEKEKKKKPQKPHEKMKRFEPRKLKNYPTFTQIGGSVNHNCFSCLDAMALYIKEFLRFSCSLTTGHPAQDTEFQERVCDMLNILRTMCRDCFYLVRYVLRLLFVD